MKLSGAQIILKKLIEHGIGVVFEFPGGSICPILDELARYKKIKILCFRHEQAAIHAADAYARVRKSASVCMATSGPGASNLVTGIANAYMDSVPLVVITGQVAVWDLKKNRPVRQRGFQELDIISVVKSITKAAFLVNDPSELAAAMDKAFFIAREGRPGPVLIDVPINVQYTTCVYKEPRLKLKEKRLVCSRAVIKETVKRLISAKKPLILAGGGVLLASAGGQLQELVQRYSLPVAETLMGLTSVPCNYEFNLGMVGYAGSRISRCAVKEADFILGLGLRFDNRAFPEANKEFSGSAYIVHVDCDKNELDHRVIVDKAILSDVNFFLKKLLQELKNKKYRVNESWLVQIRSWKNDYTVLFSGYKPDLTPQFILDRLSGMLGDKRSIVTTDVGQHQLWTAQYFRFRQPNSLITSGGLGTMGFGLPASIGAQIACPKAHVLNITSDGSFQMNIQELATINRHKLPIKIILLNNRCLGLVRQIQEFAFAKRYVSTRVNAEIDFVKIARAYGISAFRVKNPQDVESALKMAIRSKKSTLVEFMINEFENVYPVRIKGRTIHK